MLLFELDSKIGFVAIVTVNQSLVMIPETSRSKLNLHFYSKKKVKS